MPAGSHIRIVNARQHNLKGVTLELPHRRLIVVTGPSGSGKSSLAINTLFAEGQRRYIESLSTYAKQFLERVAKPQVDLLEGLAPAVAIEQHNPVTTSRSTVGTTTECFDYLRLLWARVGRQHCLECGERVGRDNPATASAVIAERLAGRIQVAFPLPQAARTDQRTAVENLLALGFVRAEIDGEPQRFESLPGDTVLETAEEVLVIVDRLADAGDSARLRDAIAVAFQEGEGVAVVLGAGAERLRFTEHPSCSACDTPAASLRPALFSFNNPQGACPACNGFGAVLEYDESLVVPDPELSLADGAIDPWTKPRYAARRRLLVETARKLSIDPDKPWRRIAARDREKLLHGKVGRYQGIFPFLKGLERKRYKQYIRVFLRQYQLAHPCGECGGTRLNPAALAVKVGDLTIAKAAALTVTDLLAWLESLELSESDREVAQLIAEELNARVRFLAEVGLGYLTLDRQTRTLSGGEAQRISLANSLGARLVDALYVLDEPSIGLHPRDIDRLLGLLRTLRDYGNTLVVVEHDPAAIEQADFMLELGPGAGEQGGEVVHAGPPSEARETLTGAYLAGRKRIGIPSGRRTPGPLLKVKGASLHNISELDVAFPLYTLTAVTGVSGSGKSTLVHDIVYRQLRSRLAGDHGAKSHLGESVGSVSDIEGWRQLKDVVLIDQSPIGRSPRSNPITYVKAFDEIRELFASQPLARERRYSAATFSFNLRGGRCKVCDGAGHLKVEMVFMADVFVPCESCGGSRYRPEVLEVKIQGNSIHDVLQWTVDQAINRFRHQPRLGQALWQLQQVGLGYLRLGQPATTLSGGEAQRLKIARELIQAGKRAGAKLYLLDEPTTGLHLEDVRVLLKVLDRLVDAGNTVVVIEHHLDLIKRADWVIDIGPEAGSGGGRVVAAGTPEDVAATPESITGKYLAKVLATVEDRPARNTAGPVTAGVT